MKTTRIASLFAITLSIVLAAPASAAPASKRMGPAFSGGQSTAGSPADHKAMKRVGPPGKGSICNH